MSRLLTSKRTAPVAEWKAELATWAGKLAAITNELAAKELEAADTSRDPWFGEQLKPMIDLLHVQRNRTTEIVAGLKQKLAAAEAAHPGILKEHADAYKERDGLGVEIAKRFPELIAELFDLMERAAANERRLLRVAASGEGEIDSTSPWDRARDGKHHPLIVQGPRRAAPSIDLQSLTGEHLWPKTEGPLNWSDLPLVVTATNNGDKPVFTSTLSGRPVVIEPGNSLSATSISSGLVNAPTVELRVR